MSTFGGIPISCQPKGGLRMSPALIRTQKKDVGTDRKPGKKWGNIIDLIWNYVLIFLGVTKKITTSIPVTRARQLKLPKHWWFIMSPVFRHKKKQYPRSLLQFYIQNPLKCSFVIAAIITVIGKALLLADWALGFAASPSTISRFPKSHGPNHPSHYPLVMTVT